MLYDPPEVMQRALRTVTQDASIKERFSTPDLRSPSALRHGDALLIISSPESSVKDDD